MKYRRAKVLFGKSVTLVLFLCSITLILLGSHGLYIYFYKAGVMKTLALGLRPTNILTDAGQLFGQLSMPEVTQGIVSKYTEWGAVTWYLPVVSMIVGIVLIWKGKSILRWFGIWC